MFGSGMLDLFAGGPAGVAPVPVSKPEPEPERGGGEGRAEVPASEESRLLGVVKRAGAPFERLVLTRNRRVMLSVARGGTTLRMHEVFRAAPQPVLEAVGRFFDARRRDQRRRARSVIAAFLGGAVPAAPRRGSRRTTDPFDAVHVQRLRLEFDRVNRQHFGGALPEVPIHISGRMTRRNGHFSAKPLEIVVSRRLCVLAEDGEAERTLRHEMIHLWQHVEGRAIGHGTDFRRMARRLDVHPRATRPVRWIAGAMDG
jgi:hypothetical protein